MQRYRMLGDVRFRRFEPEWVVLKQDSGEVLVVNELGGRVLQLLQGRAQTVTELVETLLPEYDVTQPVLTSDVERFVAQLHQAQVVEPA